MDINLNYSEDDNPLALKSDFILSLCELVIGGKEGLQPVEKQLSTGRLGMCTDLSLQTPTLRICLSWATFTTSF